MVANFVGDCLFGGNTEVTAKLQLTSFEYKKEEAVSKLIGTSNKVPSRRDTTSSSDEIVSQDEQSVNSNYMRRNEDYSISTAPTTALKPKNKAHKDVKFWYKFQNNIVFVGVPYIVTFNIRDRGKAQYQYLIEFVEDKTPGLSNTVVKDFVRTDQASNNRVA